MCSKKKKATNVQLIIDYFVFWFLVFLNQINTNQRGHLVAMALGCLFPPGLLSQNILPWNGGTASKPSILFCRWSSLDPAPDLLDQTLHLKRPPPPSNPPPPFSRHGERVVTLFRCYHAPLSWSLVTENVVNPPHQWEGADWLTLRFQKGSRDWGDEHGRWPSPQTNPEPNERKRDKNPKARMCEIWTTGFFLFFLKKNRYEHMYNASTFHFWVQKRK